MGLDTSHDCWHGAYSAFHRWRQALCKAMDYPPLDLMEGFYEPGGHRDVIAFAQKGLGMRDSFADIQQCLPIKWSGLKPSPLQELLYHSDCDGEIPAELCAPIADALEELLPKLPKGEDWSHIGNWRDKTQQFIDGLRAASAAGEAVDFH